MVRYIAGVLTNRAYEEAWSTACREEEETEQAQRPFLPTNVLNSASKRGNQTYLRIPTQAIILL